MSSGLESELKVIERKYGGGLLCTLLNCFPDVFICCAIGLGLYTRWVYYGYILIFALGLCGLFLFATNLALRYYFSVNVFNPLFHVWLSTTVCLIGLWDDYRLSSTQKHLDDLVDIFFVTGSISHFITQALLLICKNKSNYSFQNTKILNVNDYARIIGMTAACFAAKSNVFPLLYLVLAVYINFIAIRFKSIIAILNIICLCILTELYLFPALNLSINPFAIICALSRLYNKPILELFIVMPSVTRLERYSSVILSRKVFLRLLIFAYLALELNFFYFHAKEVKNHKEWYVVVPLFVMAAIFWFLTRLLICVVLHNLVNKFYQCKLCLMSNGIIEGRDDSSTDIAFKLKKVLAAKGLRYFGLIAHKLVYVSITTTVLIVALCWTTFSPYSHASTSIVLAFQILLCELLNEFTYNLDGTCIGYGVIVPVAVTRSDNLVSVLPQQFVHSITVRSTACVDSVVKFFSQHLIHNFGCDLSMSGLDWADMRKKLAAFFAQSTVEGPPYDTYVLYYSGPVNDKGDWAVTGNTVISLDNILELWRENGDADDRRCSQHKNSRLILICDCDHSDQWLKCVKKLPSGVFVGLQTFSVSRTHRSAAVRLDNKDAPVTAEIVNLTMSNSEAALDIVFPPSVGDFTRLWVEYNGPNAGSRILFDTLSPDLQPRYQVSKSWSDFRFARPNSSDICDYWRSYLPSFVSPALSFVVDVVNTPSILPGSDIIFCTRLFKRWRLKFFPPAELDTGHGFKLVKF